MFDKITIYIDRIDLDSDNVTLLSKLDNIKPIIDYNTGEILGHKGRHRKLKVTVRRPHMYIDGSICKYYFGNNLHTLNRETTQKALEQLSTALNFDLDTAKVTSLEFGTNIILDNPVSQYLNLMGDHSKLDRLECTKDTLYYRSKGKKQSKNHSLYDKGKESKKKKVELPQNYKGKNILRYELRYSGKLPQQLKVDKVVCSTLFNEDFYNSMMARYKDFFFSIPKKQNLIPNIESKVKTMPDGFNAVVAWSIGKLNPSEVSSFLNQFDGVYRDKKTNRRLKKKVADVLSGTKFSEPSDLMKELNEKIENIT